MLEGETIQLYETVQTGTDELGAPVYQEIVHDIENVLIGYPSSEEILSTLNLTGRKAVYTLAIPRGDENDWENKKVEFWGQTWKTIGIPVEGIEKLLPPDMEWNKIIQVERYG